MLPPGSFLVRPPLHPHLFEHGHRLRSRSALGEQCPVIKIPSADEELYEAIGCSPRSSITRGHCGSDDRLEMSVARVRLPTLAVGLSHEPGALHALQREPC